LAAGRLLPLIAIFCRLSWSLAPPVHHGLSQGSAPKLHFGLFYLISKLNRNYRLMHVGKTHLPVLADLPIFFVDAIGLSRLVVHMLLQAGLQIRNCP